jgi:hypothetical protein
MREWLKRQVGRFFRETGEMLKHKAAQGAAEVTQGLFSQSNAYVPYGYGQEVTGPKGPTQDWNQQLRDAAQRGGQIQNEMER